MPPDSVHSVSIPRKSHGFIHQVSAPTEPEPKGRDLTANLNDSGIAETLCVLLFSNASGRWIDNASSRLRPLLLTIVTNRITVVVCCLLWFLILTSEAPTFKQVLFAVVVILGMVEKVSRMANVLSMERDWVPTIANPPIEGMSVTKFDLTHLNTIMRRIDMLCKFLAPMAVATFISVLAPIKVAIVVVAVFSMSSWSIECWTVKKVWHQNRRLRVPKDNLESEMGCRSLDEVGLGIPSTETWVQLRSIGSNLARKVFAYTKESFYSHKEGIRYFFSSPVWIPSLCVAILHASVLSWSATLFTYLLNAGFSLGLITVARAVGSFFEIGSTFIFPWAVHVLSGSGGTPHAKDFLTFPYMDADEHPDAPLASNTERESVSDGKGGQRTQMSHHMNTGVVRVGLWGICGLMIALVGFTQAYQSPEPSHLTHYRFPFFVPSSTSRPRFRNLLATAPHYQPTPSPPSSSAPFSLYLSSVDGPTTSPPPNSRKPSFPPLTGPLSVALKCPSWDVSA